MHWNRPQCNIFFLWQGLKFEKKKKKKDSLPSSFFVALWITPISFFFFPLFLSSHKCGQAIRKLGLTFNMSLLFPYHELFLNILKKVIQLK